MVSCAVSPVCVKRHSQALAALRSGPGTPGRTSSLERTASEASAAPLRKQARSAPARAGCTSAKRGWTSWLCSCMLSHLRYIHAPTS